MSNTIDIMEYEKVNPKTRNVVKVKKGKGDVCKRAKSQVFNK